MNDLIKLKDVLEFNNGIYEDTDFINKIKKLPYSKEILFDKDLDYIAFKEYKNQNLWWIIGYYNDIIDPFNKDNRILKIPNENSLIELIVDYKQKFY